DHGRPTDDEIEHVGLPGRNLTDRQILASPSVRQGLTAVPGWRSYDDAPRRRTHVPADTFFVYAGVYDDPGEALADYEAVKDLHTEADLIDAYDAAVIERRADGKVKITKKHKTPTRVARVLGAAIGLPTPLP